MSALRPGSVWAVGGPIGSAKIEVRTEERPHPAHGRPERHTVLTVRDGTLDRSELASLREALTEAARWVK